MASPPPLGDVEIITIGAHVLEALGLLNSTTLELNSLGDPESRRLYRAALVEYFGDHKALLSEDSVDRLQRNPLRILDSKDAGDQEVIVNAPLFGDYLNQASVEFFEQVKHGLDTLGIRYRVNPRLVRGLDYYTHTAFEFVTTELGAQGAVLAGGRYDGLVEMIGGPPTPGIGWAAGIERLAMLMRHDPPMPGPIAVVPVGEVAESEALKLAQTLRHAGYAVDLGFGGNLIKRMKRANKLGARAAVLLGEDELRQRAATVRDLRSGEQELIPLGELVERLARFY